MKLFAIFGNPVSHSKSPLMHNFVFKNLSYKACYTRIHLEDSTKLREKFFQLDLSGANITVPYKEAAYEICDEIRGFAKKAKVVNTIIKQGDKLIGYNTDADGFMYAIREFENIKKILVLGAGGTAKALVRKFLDQKIKVVVLNRSKNRLSFFEQIGAKCYVWDDFNLDDYDLIVNTTSAGLNDENLPVPIKIIDNIMSKTKYVADAIYGKETPFLKKAKEFKIPYIDGQDMLIGQGILANELFCEGKFDRKEIEAQMLKIILMLK